MTEKERVIMQIPQLNAFVFGKRAREREITRDEKQNANSGWPIETQRGRQCWRLFIWAFSLMSLTFFVLLSLRGIERHMCLYAACVHVYTSSVDDNVFFFLSFNLHNETINRVFAGVCVCVANHMCTCQCFSPPPELPQIIIEVGNRPRAGVCIVDRSLFRALLVMIGGNLPTWSNMVPDSHV